MHSKISALHAENVSRSPEKPSRSLKFGDWHAKRRYYGAWMKTSDSDHSAPLAIPPEIAAKCDGPNQAETFDRGIRAFLSVPKLAVLKEEAKAKRRKLGRKQATRNQ